MGTRARIALVVVAIAVVFAVVRFVPLDEVLARLEMFVRERGSAGALVFGLVYVVAVLLFVPGSLLTLAAGVLFGVVWGTVIVSAASTAAAALSFLVARHLARGWVEGLAARNARFRALDQAIREQGWRVVALLRLSPVVPFSLSNYLYGLTPVAFGPYVLASWIAMLPATVLYVSLGAAGRAAAGGGRGPAEWVLIGVGIAATAAASLLITRAARRRLDLVKGPAAEAG